MKLTKFILLLFISATVLNSCKKEEDPIDEDPTPDPYAATKQQIKDNYAAIAFAVYEDSYDKAVILNQKIVAFVAAPSATTLSDAQQAWLDAREVYGQTEVFRFAGGPIDDDIGPEGFINAWPMDESFVDYVQGNPTSGIINDATTYPTIDATLLLSLNESGSETNIATGFHAIEFLLWGQDLSSSTAGVRSHLDYVNGGGTAINEIRRGTYLTVCGDLLEDMLEQVKDEWDPAISSNYRSEFVAMDNTLALHKMFNSMAVLSHNELAGERIYVAYDNQNQEDEHSCFSDNTHRDIILNAKGIKNIYTGQYLRADGTTLVTGSSIEDLMASVNATINTEVLTLLNDSEAWTNSIYNPFDQAIVLPGERPTVLSTVQSLQAEGNKLVQAAAALGITINL